MAGSDRVGPVISTPPPSPPATIEVPLDQIFCPCCQKDLGSAIRLLPHVVGAEIDLERKVALVTFHSRMTDGTTLRRHIADCNFRNPVPLPTAAVSSHESMHHAAAKTMAHEAIGDGPPHSPR